MPLEANNTMISMRNITIRTAKSAPYLGYVGFIIEQLGLVDGVSSEFMMLIAIENLASASGVRAEDIVVFSVEEGMFNDLPSATITYGGALENINVIFRNTIVIDENLTMQAATYTIGAEVTDSFERLHDGFLDAIVLN
jgi:hypothetical protein